jgi:hypothetical protein
MIRIVRWLLWLLVSLVIVSGIDQALIRVPMKVPVLEQFQEFYIDFRSRLLGLAGKKAQPTTKKPSIEQVIETTEKKAAMPSKTVTPRYLYVDDTGTLQFAESLEAIPKAYRKDAQPMEQ